MQRISINNLPPQGQEFVIDDPAVWAAPMAEFHMGCRVLEAISATVTVIPVENGCLVRGRLSGRIALPCNRCAEDAIVALDDAFETFECLPGTDTDGEEGDAPFGEESHILLEEGAPMLDIAAVCWEEFSLALPVNPLCKPDCKGLCSSCGANLNAGSCTCVRDEGDPRLAVLRNITITNSGS